MAGAAMAIKAAKAIVSPKVLMDILLQYAAGLHVEFM
jgi:hypothetical protein